MNRIRSLTGAPAIDSSPGRSAEDAVFRKISARVMRATNAARRSADAIAGRNIVAAPSRFVA